MIEGRGCTINPSAYLLLAAFDSELSPKDELKALLADLESRDWQLDGKSCKLNLVMSATCLPANAKLDELISKLESACFTGMKSGTTKLNWLEAAEQKPQQLDQTVKALLEKKAFKLMFQPVVNLETDKTMFEALIRLEDKQGRLYAPAQFLPWLETTLEGGSLSLDHWLIKQALTLTAAVQAPAVIIKLASPLSRVVSLLPELRYAARASEQDDKRLYLSLPVSAVMQDVDKTRQVIESFAELGCGIILEKVEAQEAHLKLLRDLGYVDFIRINSSGTHSDALDKFISLVKTSAEAPGIIIAGVEDSLMLSHYWERGIRHFQGYFIQEPGEELLYREHGG